ncbi:MAG TPA: hypothetical protein VEY10_17280 [Flavisolibacter sp.]|nr:hypothetical protein [Flavisolibacter sp.]
MRRVINTVLYFPVLLSCSLNTAEKKVATNDTDWTHDSTAHFKLHAQKEVRSKDSLKALGTRLEVIQQQLLAIMKETKAISLEVYFLKDRETLTSYTGFPANGYTDATKGIIYFVDKAPFHLSLRHEMMHALSWRLWGNPKGYWLSEGNAVFASGNCAGYDLHILAHQISKQNKMVPFQTLVDDFDFRALEPSLQSASLVKYIYDTYGIAALKAFWQKGLQESINIIGIPAPVLEKNWRDYIDQEKYEVPIDWNKIKESGCE